MKLSLSSRLSLVKIQIQKDKKHYIIEDIESGEFYEMPEICLDAIVLIQLGEPLYEVENKIRNKYSNGDVDILDFAKQLFDMDLIFDIDGEKVKKKQLKKESLGLYWISPNVGKFFFNRFALIIYSLLFLVNVILLIYYPTLFPHYKDLFVFDVVTLNIPFLIVLTFVLVLIHEFGHILAIRAHNLPTKLETGHRLFFVVLETNMLSVWKLHSKERNILYLAGICFDTVILFLALISQLIFSPGSTIFHSIMHIVVLETFIRMVYQCCIYMKTDLYYVLENVTGCYNLMENAKQIIGRFYVFQKFSSHDTVIFDSERKTVLLYSIFYFVGVILTIFLYIVFYIPQLLFAWRKILPGFSEELTSLPFWDSTLFILQIALFFFLLINSWRKKYLQK